MRWNGLTFKKHPVTGEDVPDETAQVPRERYLNPRPAAWPEADFVVGNPPFIGNKRMRIALGDGYVEALRSVWHDVPDTADFVMYWWEHAAQSIREGKLRRFGLITTNSLRQTFNRQIIERHLAAQPPLHLAFAIPDHPWVDGADGAAVRVAMTVGGAGDNPGRLFTVASETTGSEEDATTVSLSERIGTIHADLTVGADVSAAPSLRSNQGIAFTGMYPLGQGFILLPEEVPLAVGTDADRKQVLKPFVIARDLTQSSRRAHVIDFFPRSMDDARIGFPCLFQWVLDRVKPERDHNNRESRRLNWWLFGEPVASLRQAISSPVKRYIAVPRTAKWFSFQFVPADTIPDTSVVAIATDDAFVLGVLSTTIHLYWAWASGGTLEDRPRYQHKQTFNPFPFPAATPAQQARIRALAEELDTHRKRQQVAHPELTLTGMYNVLEKLRSGEVLSAKDKAIHTAGLVSVLKTLHDELDRTVLDAYGWSDLVSLLAAAQGDAPPTVAGQPDRDTARRCLTDTLLERLVALNTQRAAEEARGQVRWLRPEFQNPGATQARITDAEVNQDAAATTITFAKSEKLLWPASLPEQVAMVARILAESPPLTEAALASHFTGRGPWKKRLPQILETLIAFGRARRLAVSTSDRETRYTTTI
jgi:hypothetical protein